MSHKLELLIKEACLYAIKSLGTGYKGMSCFLFNWQSAPAKAHDADKKAA